ncbi:hypothetical protein CsSME_00029572 [Camellia sinensis var. sinensis]
MDQRYKGIAHGVGQSEILGWIHVAPIKVGNVFYPCSFVILDSPNMDFLFGLVMLRKHQDVTSDWLFPLFAVISTICLVDLDNCDMLLPFFHEFLLSVGETAAKDIDSN